MAILVGGGKRGSDKAGKKAGGKRAHAGIYTRFSAGCRVIFWRVILSRASDAGPSAETKKGSAARRPRFPGRSFNLYSNYGLVRVSEPLVLVPEVPDPAPVAPELPEVVPVPAAPDVVPLPAVPVVPVPEAPADGVVVVGVSLMLASVSVLVSVLPRVVSRLQPLPRARAAAAKALMPVILS